VALPLSGAGFSPAENTKLRLALRKSAPTPISPPSVPFGHGSWEWTKAEAPIHSASYIDSSRRLRCVPLFLQLLRQSTEPPIQPIRLDIFEPLLVNPGCTVIGFAAIVGVPQNVISIHLVVQRIEPKARLSLRFGMERRLQLLNTRRSYQVTQSPVPRCF
jgi:hypothetical protein